MKFWKRAALLVSFFALACVLLTTVAYQSTPRAGYICWDGITLESSGCGWLPRPAWPVAFQNAVLWAGVATTLALVTHAAYRVLWWLGDRLQERRGSMG